MKFQKINLLLDQSDNSSIEPSEFLQGKILRSYQTFQKSHGTEEKKGFIRKKYFSPALLTAASVIILVTAAIVFKSFYIKTGAPLITLQQFSGSVRIGDVSAEHEQVIKAGTTIQTEKGSFGEITFKDNFRIVLNEDTTLKIVTSEFSDAKNAYVFDFHLVRGTVYSKFSHNGTMEYTFKTPDVLIHSIGTEFLLDSSDRTTLLLTEGTVKLRRKGTQQDIDGSSNKKYLIKDSIDSSPLAPKDLEMVADLKNKTSVSDDDEKLNKNKNIELEKAKEKRKERREVLRNINRERKAEMRKMRKSVMEPAKQMRKLRKNSKKN